jgi:hypothetical protein
MPIYYDPQLYASKTLAMQRLADFARRGYPYHASGKVPREKVARFAAKMADKYWVHRTKDQRRHDRARGYGAAVLVLHPCELEDAFRFWLLVSREAGHPAHAQERLRNYLGGKDARLRWGEEFELLRRTRPRIHGGGEVLTWQLQAQRLAELRASTQAAARQQGVRQAQAMLGQLARLPGFGGVRTQVHGLLRQFRADWARHHRGPPPTLPRLPYVGRLQDERQSLSQWLARYAEIPGEAPETVAGLHRGSPGNRGRATPSMNP